MTNENHCSECGATISARAITCGVACRMRRYKRHREETLMAGAAGVRPEVGALLRAIDSLGPARLAPLARFFADTANANSDNPAQAEVLHAIARLMAGIRDHNEHALKAIEAGERALKRARHGGATVEPCAPVYGPLSAEDAALVAAEKAAAVEVD